MAKMGRPAKSINQKEFENLCRIQCTEAECAAYFQVEVSTLHRWVKLTYKTTFAKVFEAKRGDGRVSLRRSLYQRAIDTEGPPAIAIFVAKNHLGMADEYTARISGPKEALVPAITPEAAQIELDSRTKKRVPQKP